MKPTDFSQFDHNPFDGIINSGKGQPAPQGGQQGGAQMTPLGSDVMAGSMPGAHFMNGGKAGAVKTPPNQLEYGSVGGTTPSLTSALQAIQKFISESQDPTEIAIGRTIITLLTKLIAADQQKQTGQLPQGQPQGQVA